MVKEVLILGAGFGGLELASNLSANLRDKVSVTLIDKSDSFMFGFSKFEVMTGHKTAPELRSYYKDIAKKGVTFKQETVTAIDAKSKQVTTNKGTHKADILVVALGANTHPEATSGFVEDGAHEFYSVDGAIKLRPVLESFKGGRIVVAVLGTPFKCPPAPSESGFVLDEFFTARGIRAKVKISVIVPFGIPIPVSMPASKAILTGFKERDIEFLPGRLVSAVNKGTAHVKGGEDVKYDLFLGVPVHRVPDVVQKSGLAEGGWVPVNPANLMTRFPDVYAVGDVTSAPVPKAGVFAESAGRAVAHDIAARLAGGTASPYDGAGSCYFEMGGGKVGRVDANFLTGPNPTAPFTGPSLGIASEKEEFARTRRVRWFKD